MGWEIAQKAGKVRIWSTISDAWLTDWLTRDEALSFYYDDALLTFKKHVIKTCLSFPHHWPEHGNGRRAVCINQEGSDRYLAWIKELASKPDEDYESFVDETFNTLLERLHRREDAL